MSSCAKSGMSLTHAVALLVTVEPPRGLAASDFLMIQLQAGRVQV